MNSSSKKLYKAFIKRKVRKATCEMEIPLWRAIDFLKENPKYGIIEDYDGTAYTKEELEHVKNFGSNISLESDFDSAPAGEIPESSYRELFGTLGDNTE